MSNRIIGAAVAAAIALVPSSAWAQEPGPLEVDQAPEIVGDPYIGSTLTAGGGAWVSPNPEPSRTEAAFEWYRCPTAAWTWRCTYLNSGPSHALTTADRGRYIVLVRWVRWLRNPGGSRPDWQYRWRAGTALGPVTVAPEPTPAATPTPEPPPPEPVPTFDTATPTATPVPTTGQVLRNSAERRVLRPFPVVRMRGRLTVTGARVTLLSVKAPRRANVTVRCRGRCPAARWSQTNRKRRLTRVRAFERELRSGTRITVTVTRRGYIGKRTVFVIRRGSAPLRVDNCLNTRGRVSRCP